MNYKHLGKYHYIYEIIANEYEIRIERHPIVYSNKDYIYFVPSGTTRARILDTPNAQTEVNYDEMLTWLVRDRSGLFRSADREFYILDKEEAKKLKEFIERFNDEDLAEFRRQKMLKNLLNQATSLKCIIETYERELAETNKKIKELGGDA